MTEYAYSFDAIGTRWNATFEIDHDRILPATVMQSIENRIAQFDKQYSRFRDDSFVLKIASEGGTHPLPHDAAPMLSLYEDLYRATEGAFTPLIGQTLVDAGYDADYSLVPGTLIPPPKMDEIMSFDHANISLTRPALLDFGAAGKGYLVDLVAEELERVGIESYVIDAGGDMKIKARAGTSVQIGLEHPANPELAIGIASLNDGSLCGSAGNRRKWDRFHHIIDPHTLESPVEIQAAWTVASTTMIADAIATCLFLVPLSKLDAYDFDYLILHNDNSIERSDFFPAELFTT